MYGRDARITNHVRARRPYHNERGCFGRSFLTQRKWERGAIEAIASRTQQFFKSGIPIAGNFSVSIPHRDLGLVVVYGKSTTSNKQDLRTTPHDSHIWCLAAGTEPSVAEATCRSRSPQAQPTRHSPWDCCVSSDNDRGQWLKDLDWLNAKQLLPKHPGKYIIFQSLKFSISLLLFLVSY